jgi:hypothetical protein
MPLLGAVPSELFIVAMDTLPMVAWSVVCDQVLRSESRATTSGLMRLRDGGQRLDNVDSLESSSKRGCNGGPPASLLRFLGMG